MTWQPDIKSDSQSQSQSPSQKFKHQAWSYLKSSFQPNFYRLHLSYFVAAILIASAILWGSNTDSGSLRIRYIDALFLCCSAICNAGLNTVKLDQLNGFQQSVLFVMMLMGELTLVSISMVIVRRYYFGKRIKDFLQHSKAGQRVAGDIEQNADHSGSSGRTSASQVRQRRHEQPRQEASGSSQNSTTVARRSRQPRHYTGYGGFPAPWQGDIYGKIFRPFHNKIGGGQVPEHPYLSFQPKLDNRGRFHSLTPEQEQELGGVEYRALKLLTWLLPAYTLFWLFIIMVVMKPYAAHTSTANVIKTAQPGNLSPVWWSIFTSVSAYSNCGLSLLRQSMIPLSNNYLILIFTGMVTLAGNTLYPIFLRLSIILLSKIVPRNSEMHHSLTFLLHHPRRCYPFLFPAKNTWILLLVQITIFLTAWALFIILNINYTPVDPLIPGGLRTFQGLFQAHGVRASGFYIILLSDVAPALQFFYMVVMYISAFPIIMSIRQTNVYEERSLGQDDDSKNQSTLDDPNKQAKAESNLGQHIRRQLAYDIWWILICVWLVSIIERPQLAPSPPAATTPSQPTSLPTPAPGFTLFSIVFETVSAYGTVGLTLGVPYNNYSFSGAWHSLSKLILMSVMLRGRHRILPMAVDRAILLPGQDIMEEMDRKSRGDSENGGERRTDEAEIRKEEEGEEVEHETGAGKDDKVRDGKRGN